MHWEIIEQKYSVSPGSLAAQHCTNIMAIREDRIFRIIKRRDYVS